MDAQSLYRLITPEDFHGAPYQDHVIALRNGPYLDFPAGISIETMSLCNAACEFCPYPKLTRKGSVMPDGLIEKIFDDIQEIQGRPPFSVTLARVNEPFLDNRILDISAEIERRFPEARNVFFSNGTPLTEKNLLRLGELRQIDYLNISVNDHRPSRYEQIMALPFVRTLSRLDLIHRMKLSGLLKFPVYVSRVGDGTAADREFLEWVKNEYPALCGLVTTRCDWFGEVQGLDPPPAPNVGCRQWFHIDLLADGRDAFCCIDSEGLHGLGDANRQHVIHEMYNHPLRRGLRTFTPARTEVNTCKGCSLLP